MPVPELDISGITPELLPKDWTFCGSWSWCFLPCFFVFIFYYPCIINFTITILLSLFLPPSCSFLSLCYNSLLSQLLFFPIPIHSFLIFTSLLYLPPTCHHTTPPSYTLNTCWLAYCTIYTQSQPLAIPYTSTLHSTTEIHPNTHKVHKTLQPW
jgi:membrane-associated phospholipid phosphatase